MPRARTDLKVREGSLACLREVCLGNEDGAGKRLLVGRGMRSEWW
jgi:hypothetical protein